MSWWLRAPPSPQHQELWLVVEEIDCASGEPPDDRIEVEVDETESQIRLSVRIRSIVGEVGCPGNPPSFITVPLERPVGERHVIGGRPLFGIDASTPLRRDLPDDVPAAASYTLVGSDALATRDCLDANGDYGEISHWETTSALPTAADVAGAAIEHLGLTTDGWHVVEFGQPGTINSQSWFQYAQGAPISVIDVMPVEVGWIGGAHHCLVVPDGWQPDSTPPAFSRDDPAVRTPVLDVDDMLAAAGAEQIDELTWLFPDPGDRCPTWLRLQNQATANHHGIITAGIGTWPESLETATGTTSIEAELVLGSEAVARRIVTNGQLMHLEAVITDEVDEREPTPCQLDSVATYTIAD